MRNKHACIPVEEAAKRLGLGVEAMKQALIAKQIPIGFAIPPTTKGGNWRFVVVERRLIAYLNAEDMQFWNQPAITTDQIHRALSM